MQNKIGVISGVVGGFGKYLLEVNVPFENRIWQAIIAAFICGMAGLAGKDCYLYIKKRIKEYVGKN